MVAPTFLLEALELVIAQHGCGVVFCLLDSMSRCHIAKIDTSRDGVFMKAFYDKKAARPDSHGAGSNGSLGSISREAFLRMRSGSTS